MKSHLSVVAPFAVVMAAMSACTMFVPTRAWSAERMVRPPGALSDIPESNVVVPVYPNGAPPPVMAQSAPPLSFVAMNKETGCDSKNSVEKRADIFAAKYKGQPMTVTGLVAHVNKGTVQLKLLKGTAVSDITIEMADPASTYDLQQDTKATIAFTVYTHGGCFLNFSGRDGVLK